MPRPCPPLEREFAYEYGASSGATQGDAAIVSQHTQHTCTHSAYRRTQHADTENASAYTDTHKMQVIVAFRWRFHMHMRPAV